MRVNIRLVYMEIKLYGKISLCRVQWNIFYVYPTPVLNFVLGFELYVCLHLTFLNKKENLKVMKRFFF